MYKIPEIPRKITKLCALIKSVLKTMHKNGLLKGFTIMETYPAKYVATDCSGKEFHLSAYKEKAFSQFLKQFGCEQLSCLTSSQKKKLENYKLIFFPKTDLFSTSKETFNSKSSDPGVKAAKEDVVVPINPLQ